MSNLTEIAKENGAKHAPTSHFMVDELNTFVITDAQLQATVEQVCAEKDARIAELERKAALWDWVESNCKTGARHNGMVLNTELLNGHRHRNRLMYSFIIRAENASESVDIPLIEAIEREIKS